MQRQNTYGEHSTQWSTSQKIFLVLLATYSLFLTCIVVVNSLGPEHFWFSTVNLYLPQLAWGLPAFLFFPFAFLVRGHRPWLVALPLVPLLLVVAPLMGLRGYLPKPQPEIDASKPALRIMTYNIENGKEGLGVLLEITRSQPDILLMQEFGSDFEKPFLNAFPGWNIKIDGELAIATRFPLSQFERKELPKLSNDRWKQPAYVRAVVDTGDTKVALYNCHLSTPRSAFEALRHRAPSALDLIAINTRDRLAQGAALASAIAQETRPTVLGGDFNAPENSLVLLPIQQSNFRNTFSEAGTGYGYTKGHDLRLGLSFVRIDHLYASKHWAVHNSFAGDKAGSDHRPMIAELTLSNR
jgi:vancomycin resistance protein VanJ